LFNNAFIDESHDYRISSNLWTNIFNSTIYTLTFNCIDTTK